MNSTVLSIRTDTKTKKQIAAFAASVGMPTSTFVTAVVKQAMRDRRVVLEPDLKPTPYLEKIMREADEDIKAGRTYGPFDTVDDMFAALEKEDEDDS